jgi:hypothetical protein
MRKRNATPLATACRPRCRGGGGGGGAAPQSPACKGRTHDMDAAVTVNDRSRLDVHLSGCSWRAALPPPCRSRNAHVPGRREAAAAAAVPCRDAAQRGVVADAAAEHEARAVVTCIRSVACRSA